ncbi:MAG: RIP metalloprotease RseP [Magnetospirillum sp.]|nr:RIP metalloprotease RseP [Magnetospirillum sp.]
MDFLAGIWNYVVVFLIILTVVVFVHEAGHYLVARWNGVKVDVFSIGFGPEVWGYTAKSGTRWRVSLLPLGGYVKMFGDADAASATGDDRPMSEAEKAVSFRHKRVGQRAAIVFAGPAANFIFAIVGMAMLLVLQGEQVMEPVVGQVQPNSAAEQAGLRAGDRVLSINGSAIGSFLDIKRTVLLHIEEPLTIQYEREGSVASVLVRPRIIEVNGKKQPLLGIAADATRIRVVNYNPLEAVGQALQKTEIMVTSTFIGIGQMINGSRDSEELGGPIAIAKGAGEAAQGGLSSVVFYTILLSLNLGLINLFPIPVLDGGHLLFYAAEAILGRPLGEKAQEYGFRIGLFLVLALMVFATRNDIVSLPMWDVVKRLLS